MMGEHIQMVQHLSIKSGIWHANVLWLDFHLLGLFEKPNKYYYYFITQSFKQSSNKQNM